MGIARGTGRNDNSTMKWREREYIKEIAKEHDLEILDKKTDRRNLTVDEYKIYAEQIEKQYCKYMSRENNVYFSKIPLIDKITIENSVFDRLYKDGLTSHVTGNKI